MPEKPKRVDFRSEGANFRSEWASFRSEGANFRSERADFRSVRTDFGPEMADFRPERVDFRHEMADFRPERADFRHEMVDFRSERVDFRPERAWRGTHERTKNGRTKVPLCSTGHCPLWGCCPKRKKRTITPTETVPCAFVLNKARYAAI